MFDGCIVMLLARLLAIENKLDDLAETFSPALKAMIGRDWAAGYELFIAPNQDIGANEKEKFRSSVEEHAALRQILQTSADSPTGIRMAIARCIAFRQIVDRERSKKITALLENKILDAHFLPVLRPSEPLGEGPGYVILFRQILSIPGSLLESLKVGVRSLDEFPVAARAQADEVLQCPSEIVANVVSPHVEHILQRFSNVFGRVGVANCSLRYREWLVKTTCEGNPI